MRRPTVRSLLAVRPFQVNPPYQWLNAPAACRGSIALELDKSRRMLEVDDRVVALGAAPDAFGGATFDEGDVVAFLSDGEMPLCAKRRRSAARRVGRH